MACEFPVAAKDKLVLPATHCLLLTLLYPSRPWARVFFGIALALGSWRFVEPPEPHVQLLDRERAVLQCRWFY